MDEKNQEQSNKEKLEKAGSLAGRGAADFLTAGSYEKLRNMPIIGKGAHALENAAGKAVSNAVSNKGNVTGLNRALSQKSLNNQNENADSSEQNELEDNDNLSASSNQLQETGLDENKEIGLVEKDESQKEEESSNSFFSGSGSIFGGVKKFQKKKKIIMLIISISISFLMIMLPIMIIYIKALPLINLINMAQNTWDGITEYVTKGDNQQKEKKFYEVLRTTQSTMHSNGICIDINLIASALTANTSMEITLEDTDEEEERDYRKMTKNIEILANMQIKRKKYILNDDYKRNNGNYCIAGGKEELVESGRYDSSTPEKVALNDMDSSFERFFTRRADEEKNYEYYYYYPDYDSNGRCSNTYANSQLDSKNSNSEKGEVDIGDYDTMQYSTFYWNLINSFIPDYYKDLLPSEGEARTLKIKEIARNIYSLYNIVGPNQSCNNGSQLGYVYSNICPNGITVSGYGTLDLEDYVAGVVEHEAYKSEGMEALKAQAVAARTYALNKTNYCTQPIANSTSAQTFSAAPSAKAREAAESTAGEILTYNGEVFSAQYDSFCYNDRDCPDSKFYNNEYSVTYTKVPSNETHKIVLTDVSQFGRILSGKGHAHGMSQLLSYQMAKEGKTYQEILAYFYADGVELKKVQSFGNGTSATGVADASQSDKFAYLFPSGRPASEREMNQYLTTVTIKTYDNGNTTERRVTLHSSLATDFVQIMDIFYQNQVPIKSVGCYNWRGVVGNSNSRSHHSYGTACDLNPNENYMIKNGQVMSGSLWDPDNNIYSFPANGIVVQTFASFGWTWGGSWSSSKDYMHFSFTGG